MAEKLPLATIHAAVLELIRDRDDVVLFGAQAVNAYVDEARMTQDVDLLSNRAAALVEELRSSLSGRFHIALRVRTVASGLGFRLYQVREPKNRHLVDVRMVEVLPPHRMIDHVRVLSPEDLVAYKVASYFGRRSTAKGATDLADLRRLLVAFPDLKSNDGPVRVRLVAMGVDDATVSAWSDLVEQPIATDDGDDADF